MHPEFRGARTAFLYVVCTLFEMLMLEFMLALQKVQGFDERSQVLPVWIRATNSTPVKRPTH